jgi:hypothetical protein
MARPIPKAILSQTFDSLGITGHQADSLGASMFDGAKKCPETNSDVRLSIDVSTTSRNRPAAAALDFDDFGQKIPEQGI